GGLVVRGDEQGAGILILQTSELLERGRGAVVLDEDLLEQCGVGPPRAHTREVIPRDIDGFDHLLFGVGQNVADHGNSLTCRWIEFSRLLTRVPSCSPRRAVVMLAAGSVPNTPVGMPLSMHRLHAVEATTLRPCTCASWYVIVSSFDASEF